MTDPNPNAVLHPDGRINANVLKAQYAVRGQIYEEAMKRKAAGKRVIFTNVGNPHSLGQKAITFPRQVLACVNYPELLETPEAKTLFPADVLSRSRTYLDALPGGTGAYQDSRGNMAIREEVAAFITNRDGHAADPRNVFLADGASPAIQNVLKMLIRDNEDAILLPIPQYPLYSAAVVALGGKVVGYELDESQDWALDIDNLSKRVASARQHGMTVRALCVINPGNPTGTLLSRENMESLVRWCVKEHVVLLADEVYQYNVYGSKPFISFKKVAVEMGEAAAGLEICSFHTVSKGVFGECGRRGGYVELFNIHPGAQAQLYKLFSVNLSANVDGQLMMGMMCNPPKEGDPSYPLYKSEVDAIFESLKRRALMASVAFNKLPFISCRLVEVGSACACAYLDARGCWIIVLLTLSCW
jgi:aspartate/methionine/tyrosine aminotransferase